MRRVILTKNADKDLSESYKYLLKNSSKNVAESFYLEFKTSLEFLKNDFMETRFFYKDYKRKNLLKYKYSLYFKIRENNVVIFAVIHNARDFTYLLK